MQRLLLAIIILEIPIQIDANFFYQEKDAAYGSLAGLNISITTICLAVLCVAWLYERARGTDDPAHPAFWVSLPATCYLAAVAVSALVASDRALAIFDLFLLLQAFLLYLYLGNRIRNREDVVFIVTMFSVALLMQAVIMIGIWCHGADVSVSIVKATINQSRVAGTIGSPVAGASYITLLLVPSASLLFMPVERRLKYLAAIAVTLGTIALILTQTRGAWIASAAAGVMFLVLLWRRGWMPRWAPRVILVGAVLVGLSCFHLITSRIYGDDQGSAIGRIPLIQMGLRIVADHPVLGVGAGNCHHAVLSEASHPAYRTEWLYAVHNKYILVAAETGIIGLFFFAWFLVDTVRRGWKGWHLRDPYLSPIALALAAVILGQMIHMMVDIFNGRPQVETLWCCAGLAAAIGRMDKEA